MLPVNTLGKPPQCLSHKLRIVHQYFAVHLSYCYSSFLGFVGSGSPSTGIESSTNDAAFKIVASPPTAMVNRFVDPLCISSLLTTEKFTDLQHPLSTHSLRASNRPIVPISMLLELYLSLAFKYCS